MSAARGLAAAALVLAGAAHALAQTPAVVDGTLETRAVTASLGEEVARLMDRATGPAWVGHAIAVTASRGRTGCWSPDGPGGTRGGTRVGPLRLEGPDTLFVLYRIEDGGVRQVRVASPECELDAGGLTVHWLTGVQPPDSVAWLASLASNGPDQVSSAATMAIALHAGPEASNRLIALARTGGSRRLRGNALFWVAQRAGDRAAGTIAEALDDPDTELRTRAVFALSLLPADEGVPMLIDVARANRDPAVRRQAMFWLGQSGDPRALAFFEDVLRD